MAALAVSLNAVVQSGITAPDILGLACLFEMSWLAAMPHAAQVV
jgi:hypothetical protein